MRLFACQLLALLLLVNVASGQQTDNKNKHTLYNGIELPAVWPPANQEPRSNEPMEVPYLKNVPKVIPINVGRQLFIDNFLVESTTLKREFHAAERVKENPVLTPTTVDETEGKQNQRDVVYLGHGGVFYHPKKQRFEMFYTAGWRGGLALATSKDLINWERPNLNLVGGNIILPPGPLRAGGDNSIWLDLNATDTMQRYKAIIERIVDGDWGGNFNKRTESPTHTLHTSPDGRIWSQGITTGRAADYCSIFYNPFRDVWVYSIKQNTPRGRARYYAEGENFLKGADWKQKVFWVNADKLDKPDPKIGDSAQLYSLNAVAYESILLGQFYIHLGPQNKIADEGKFPKITEIKLGFSRDGFHWDRPTRENFIGSSRKVGDWERGYLHGTTGVLLVKGDKLYFPYTGYSGESRDGHKGMYTGASIGMATLRRDGFASMNAEKKTGALTTRPVVFDGEYLFVNANTANGELRVEILDENNKVIAPYTLANSIPVKTDKTLQRITWKNAENIARLKNQKVKFRFHLTNGKLYSFWVSPNEKGASRGYLGGGGPGYDGVLDDKGLEAYK